MSTLINHFYQHYNTASRLLGQLHSLVSISARLYIAQVFFLAGLTKIKDWDTTLFLFEEEYQVPLLPYELAAYLGTIGELLFPVLLAIGLTTRFSAAALSIVNIVAVISLEEIAPAAFYLHIVWGILLAQSIVYGPGILSIDRWLKSKWSSV
ncbi:MAG: DoxX family protein [Cellvibrionaceae bacterium]